MTTLRLLVDLLCIVPRIAWAWIKTKMPSRRVAPRSRRCLWCGWRFQWEPGTFVICRNCVETESDTLRSLEEEQPAPPPKELRCGDCDGKLEWDTASLICPPCQERRRRATAKPPLTKLFCCDVDLEYQRSSYSAGVGHYQSTRAYRCPGCGRIWLYIYEWHQDSGSDADWYPQQTQHDDHTWPYLFDERTRTKVYH